MKQSWRRLTYYVSLIINTFHKKKDRNTWHTSTSTRAIRVPIHSFIHLSCWLKQRLSRMACCLEESCERFLRIHAFNNKYVSVERNVISSNGHWSFLHIDAIECLQKKTMRSQSKNHFIYSKFYCPLLWLRFSLFFSLQIRESAGGQKCAS